MNPLTVSGLCAGYHKTPFLQDIQLSLPPATISTIIGPNGCGKTTLLRTIAGLLPHQSGSIHLLGEDTSTLSRRAFASKLGFLPQLREIPSILVENYVLHGRYPYLWGRKPGAKDLALAESAMEQTKLLDLRHRKLTELSGGERQRVYLAMLIAQDPAVWLLDEPTTYLDIHFQFELLHLIEQQRAAGKTILMVLHDLSHAFSCSDQLLVMNEGRLLCTDTPAAIAKGSLMQDLFHVRLLAEDTPALSRPVFYHIQPVT